MLRQLLTRAGSLAAAMACLATSACAQEGTWTPLFDGQTLGGWTKAGSEDSHWVVKDGCIVGTGKASMLYSPKTYKNFRYRAELRINDHGNSGVYFRCPAPNGSFGEGYEAQVDSTHADPIRTGSLYTFIHIFDRLVEPDAWFTYEIECITKEFRGKTIPHITIWINGKKLYTFLDHTDAWKEGHFAFQQHDPGSRVEIRKVEVMELP
ncbi:hypothetical protein OJF2_25490 [Aquisphaera giovannonii]|uniref:3-keto-alpha-glucoside-1,2-lyase/3-keto-2-hydroxy-glucal hydratase domain-containing protein n=1 Tax=Aquisphaera giovannonii TaxID=406548 RepID=A0A5B9W025_9BACT|nr:DUF1080 domain-containing protein [Aquisphaera giovannonii]QEH34016.1 hypothetical protein OJF2_25490 [Aquisphaera giovannonii]